MLDVLGDETARRVLDATHPQAKTASEISDESGVSKSTVYRKIDALEDVGLLVEREVVGNSGPKTVYASTVERVVVEHGEDGLTAAVDRDDEAAEEAMTDRFADIWNSMRSPDND